MAPRFCGSCGAALSQGGAFCGACGSAIAGRTQPADVRSTEPVPEPALEQGPVETAAVDMAAAAAAAEPAYEPEPAEPAASPPPLEADAGDSTQSTRDSVSEGVIGGLATAAATFPLLYPAIFVAIFFVRDVMSQLLGRRVHSVEMLASNRFDWLSSAVGGFLVGAFATALAGTLLVKYVFRKADPKTYFRVGAAAMLPVAIFWAARNDARFSAVIFGLFVWLGSLLSLQLASWDTRKGKAAKEAEDAIHDARMREFWREEDERRAAREAPKGIDGSEGGA